MTRYMPICIVVSSGNELWLRIAMHESFRRWHDNIYYITAVVLEPEAICFSLTQPFVSNGCKKKNSGRKSVVVYFSDHS